MQKSIFLTGFLLILIVISGSATGRDLELSVKEFTCTDDGINITYSITNERNFTRPNVKIGFKVLVDNKPIGCKVVVIEVPYDATSDQFMEVTIPAPCKDKTYKLVSAVFGRIIKRYKIDNWISDCPR